MTLWKRFLLLLGAALEGAAWGLGLARTLALTARSPFFLDWSGTSLVVLLSAVAAGLWSLRRGESALMTLSRLTPLLLPLADLAAGGVNAWRGLVLLVGGLALTVRMHLRRPLHARLASLLLIGLALAVYLPDIAPWVGRADTFEFQVVAPRLGIAHPSGYPLYILIGKAFSLLPFSTVAWRVNLSAAVCAALAAGVLYLALRQWHTEGVSVASAIPALLLAFSPALWPRAVEAEVYALNGLLVVLALWVGARWATGRLPIERALPLLGLLTGLGMASHLTLGALGFLLIPCLVGRPRPTWRSLTLTTLLFAAGLALYLYIPLRWPTVNGGETMSLARWWAYVTNAESAGALHPLAFLNDPARWGGVLLRLRQQVGWGGLALALVGLAVLVRRRWPLALGSALALAAWVWFALSFYVADPDYSAFLIPAHVVVFFWLGVGLSAALDLLRRRAAVLLPPAVALVALLPLSQMWLTGPLLSTDQARADDAWGRDALSQAIAPGAAILADSEKFPPLYYLQQVEGLRPDLDLVLRFDEAGYREELTTRLAAGQTVYLARYLPGLEGYALRSLGPLVEVGLTPLTALPDGVSPVGAGLGDGVELVGFDLREGEAGQRLTLYWRAVRRPQEDRVVRLRLVGADGRAVWTSAGLRPVDDNYPTNAWPVGAVVPDAHLLAPPPWVAAGEYRLEVGLFPCFGEAETPVWVPLTTVGIDAPAALVPLSHAAALAFDDIWLTGYDLPLEAVAARSVVVDLSWAGLGEAERGRLEWAAPDGARVVAGNFWLTAGAVRSHHVITAPLAPGDYRLWVSLEGRPARCGWLAPAQVGCELGTVRVLPRVEGLANFDGRILLLTAEAGGERVCPGGVLPVMLRWRALRSLGEDYTVTVQVVGPDGRLYGQADSWPVQGTRPTSGWGVGEEIVDTYSVRLAPDAPPGRYQVIVGWYLLATMERLPVVDATGTPVADHAVIAEVDASCLP